MAKATQEQIGKFFAIGASLGYNPEKLKERAKIRYKLSSFSLITKEQVGELIDLLESKEQKKQSENKTNEHIHKFVPFPEMDKLFPYYDCYICEECKSILWETKQERR